MIIFSLIVAVVCSALLFARRASTQQPDDVIDTLIKPPQYVYDTHDDSLRERALLRRRHADELRQEANRVDTREGHGAVLRRA